MTTFECKVRSGENGTVRSCTIEAENRQVALRKIKEAGDIPVSIMDRQSGNAQNPLMQAKIRLLITAAIGMILCWAAWTWMRTPTTIPVAPVPEKKSVKIEKKEPKTNGISVAKVSAVTHPMVHVSQQEQPPKKEVKQETVLTYPAPKYGKTTRVITHQGTYDVDQEGNATKVEYKKLFDTPFENQLVGMAVAGGAFVPGLLKNMSDEDVLALLKKPVVINADDTEEDKIKKEAVAALKESMLQYMNSGGSYQTFVDEMAKAAREERAVNAQGVKSVVQLLKAGDIAGARAYYEGLNATLKEKGMPQLKLPARLQSQVQNPQKTE